MTDGNSSGIWFKAVFLAPQPPDNQPDSVPELLPDNI
jgi:hypothetical protein